MFSYCAAAPTESAHQDGHNGSIGRAICETVGFVPDVPGFRFMPAITRMVRLSSLPLMISQTGHNLPPSDRSEPVNLIRHFTRIASRDVNLSGFYGHNQRKHGLPVAVARILIGVATD